MQEYIERRVVQVADYILSTGATVRDAAKVFGMSKSTIHKDMSDRLRQINRATYGEVQKVLMKNKGRILTRLQLLDRIWGYDYGGEERVVDAHIKNLRHKLPAPVIRTVKGIGYTIDNGAAGEAEP